MALQTDKSKTFPRTVVDHDDGKEYGFEFKKLNHGDLRDRLNEAIKIRRGSRRKGKKAKSQEQYEYDAKAIEFFTWNRAIKKPWPFPFPFNREEIDKLDADISDQINYWIKDINPAIERQDKGEDYVPEDEEDEDEDEGYEGEEDYDESSNGYGDADAQSVASAEDAEPEDAEPEDEIEENVAVATDEPIDGDPAEYKGEMANTPVQVFGEEEGPTGRAS